MLTVARTVGRLVEAIMRDPVTSEDLDGVDRAMAQALGGLPGTGVVFADYSQTRFLLLEDAAHLVQMFRRHNSRIERSAIVVSASSAVGVLQMERVIREANHVSRRAFRDARDAAAWLDEVLTSPERTRLRIALSKRLSGAYVGSPSERPRAPGHH